MSASEENRGRVIGIGGVFLKSPHDKNLQSWYQDHLGVPQGPHGSMFPWRAHDRPEVEHLTVWSVFPSTSRYMDQPFMINYIVEGLDELLDTLGAQGVRIDPKRENHDYGQFAWIYDLDGNKIELWEPPGNPR